MYRTLSHVAICMLLILTCVYTSKAQCPASTPLVINSVTATESRCQSSGVATVLVSGGSTPYTFSIIAGPTLSPPQSSNILQSLAPGNYTVQVTDNCNTSVVSNFTVTGTYTVPALNIITQAPSCPGSSDASITINANGRAPLSYALINPSPITRGAQAGNVFTGLPGGTYTCQVTDSCGNFQTRTVTLTAAPSTALFTGNSMQYLDCDSFAILTFFNITNYKPPYTVSATLPDGSVVTHVLTAPVVNSGLITDTFRIRYHHNTGANEMMPVTITNQCGASSTGNVNLAANFDMQARGTLPSGCGSEYTYNFDFAPTGVHCSTISYTLVSPSGALLATQTNNATFSGFPPGTGYKVIRQDCCRKDSLLFDWAAGPSFKISYTQAASYAACKDSTVSLFIQYNFDNQPADIVLVSGPPSVTFANGTVYNYTYPDTTRNVWSNSMLSGFGPGTYKLYAINNTCGQKDSLTIKFWPWDVRHTDFTASLVKGCTNANKILLNVTSNTSWAAGNVTVTPTYNQSFTIGANSMSDSIVNVSPGTYYATYQYQSNYGLSYVGMADPGCDVIKDTIVVPVYTQPVFSPSAAVALCGSIRQVALLPDSTTGVQPYQYQILSGSTTTPLQPSPVFANLAPGTYTFLMSDACPNSYSRNITIDTLTIPNVVTTGSTCVGGAAMFALPASPFYTYTWLRPNGSTSTGNTLAINPVGASDTGTYKVSVTSTIGGCSNTSSKSYKLSACQSLAETLLRFSGQRKDGHIQLNWQTADEINMSHYIVERSTDSYVFTPVQQVAAKEGMLNTYTVTDTHAPAGIVYYRLLSVEKSGAINYSNIITFSNVNAQPFNVYPSLVTGNTPVSVTCPVNSHAVFIRVVGVDGKVWQTIPVAAGVTKTRIDVSALAKGSYFVVFTGAGNAMTTQIWKE